jgi:hypothetical protein
VHFWVSSLLPTVADGAEQFIQVETPKLLTPGETYFHVFVEHPGCEHQDVPSIFDWTLIEGALAKHRAGADRRVDPAMVRVAADAGDRIARVVCEVRRRFIAGRLRVLANAGTVGFPKSR